MLRFQHRFLVVTLLLGVAASLPAQTNLISAASSWKYFNTGALPDPSWFATNFPDDEWSIGSAPLGYGEAGIASTLSYGPSATNKYITCYFRRHFNVTNPATVTGLVAAVVVDDAAVFYLNGSLVHASTNIALPVNYNTLALTEAPEPLNTGQFTLSPSGLVAGDNVLAVEVHQLAPDSSDLYFDFWLNTVAHATTNQPGGATTNASSGWTAYNDCAWHQDPNIFPASPGVDVSAIAFTTNSPIGPINGTLKSTSGVPVGVTATYSGSAQATMLARDFSLPTGTELHTNFAGRFGTNNAANWTNGTKTLTLSGLNTGRQYTVVIWSSRGGTTASYSNRWTDVVLKSADSFTNTCSAGLSRFQTLQAQDSTRVIAVIEGGRIARYDQIRPGSDGSIVFDFTAGGQAAGDVNAYLNAYMVREEVLTVNPDADGDSLPDSWEQLYFGSTNAVGGAASEDWDGDGLDNFGEYRAGTDPTTSASTFALSQIAPTSGAWCVIGWSSVTGHTYAIQLSTNLQAPWSILQSNIAAIAPMNVHTVPLSQVHGSWRIKVE